jgi:hypothetical protein
VKLYTVVVHYLQMYMKKYGCCPKFGRGDNSTCTFTKRRRACIAYKIHGRTDWVIPIYPPNFVCREYDYATTDLIKILTVIARN